jgi:nucleoid DNA-binding protein
VYGKQEIARRLANELQLTPGAAADEVDRVVAGILKKLRKGHDAHLRGVGILHPVTKKRKGPGSEPRRGKR